MDVQREGFLIVLDPSIYVEQYEASAQVRQHPSEYAEFRTAFRGFDVRAYRGTSRNPLSAYPSLDEATIEQFRRDGMDMDADRSARIEMLKRLQPQGDADPSMIGEDEDLLSTLDDAVYVRGLLDSPGEREIVLVCRLEFRQSEATLGYDVGYWGGDHYSLIADTLVAPTWHGPPDSAYAELAAVLSPLNSHLLFPTPADAAAFRSYYLTKEWAETETTEGEFCIIQVDAVGVPGDLTRRWIGPRA